MDKYICAHCGKQRVVGNPCMCWTERQDNCTPKPKTEETQTAVEPDDGELALGLKEITEAMRLSHISPTCELSHIMPTCELSRISPTCELSHIMPTCELSRISPTCELPRILPTEIAIEALREKAERENPQPLTLEELKERVGKPIWIHAFNAKWEKTTIYSKVYPYLIRNISENEMYGATKEAQEWRHFDEYGDWWLAYDHEPKGE